MSVPPAHLPPLELCVDLIFRVAGTLSTRSRLPDRRNRWASTQRGTQPWLHQQRL